MDLPARARPDLFFRVLLSHIPDSRIDRSTWNSSSRGVPVISSEEFRPAASLVRANVVMVVERHIHAHGLVLGRHHRLTNAYRQRLAAGDVSYLLCLLSLLCQCSRRLLQLSIRRHVAGGRFSCTILYARRFFPGMGK